MTKKNFVFAASFLTMLVVNAAWADIASTNYADKKVAIAQGDGNKNKAVITDDSGNVKTGQIVEGMIETGAVTVVKTTGIYGYIPAGKNKSDTAEIWVE